MTYNSRSSTFVFALSNDVKWKQKHKNTIRRSEITASLNYKGENARLDSETTIRMQYYYNAVVISRTSDQDSNFAISLFVCTCADVSVKASLFMFPQVSVANSVQGNFHQILFLVVVLLFWTSPNNYYRSVSKTIYWHDFKNTNMCQHVKRKHFKLN